MLTQIKLILEDLELAYLLQIDITLLEQHSLSDDRDKKKRTEPKPQLVAYGMSNKTFWKQGSWVTAIAYNCNHKKVTFCEST